MNLGSEGFEVQFFKIWSSGFLKGFGYLGSKFSFGRQTWVRVSLKFDLSSSKWFEVHYIWVRSNSNLNHDELKRLDNRFMNASQPLGRMIGGNQKLVPIYPEICDIWIFLILRAESSSPGIWTDRAFKKLQKVLRCVNSRFYSTLCISGHISVL